MSVGLADDDDDDDGWMTWFEGGDRWLELDGSPDMTICMRESSFTFDLIYSAIVIPLKSRQDRASSYCTARTAPRLCM